MEQMESYPLKDCEDCIHKHVCKWQDMFYELISNGAPLDGATTGCTLYLPESGMTEVPDREAIDLQQSTIQESLDHMIQKYYEMGMIPNSIMMSRKTFNLIKDQLACEEKQGKRGTDVYVSTSKGKLEVVFNEGVPTGSFFITAIA